MSQERSAKITEIREQLKSGKPALIMEAIRLCRNEGHAELVIDLMDALEKKLIPSIRDSIISLLNDLNYQHIVPLITGYISHHKAHPELQVLVSSCWQSRLNFSHQIPLFIDLLIEKDYAVALEAFTVVETSMNVATPQTLREQSERLRQSLPTLDNDKALLVKEMIRILENPPLES
jgi:hypothetical protein